MITLADLNPYCICIHNGTTYIVISQTTTEFGWDNQLNVFIKPTTNANRTSTTPETQTQIINLLQLKKVITVNGEIIQGQQEYASGINETYTNATDKFTGLKSILEGGKPLTLIHKGVSYAGQIQKMNIKEEARDVQAIPNDSDVVYTITILFLVGTDRLSGT